MTFDSLQAMASTTRRLRHAIVASLLVHLAILGTARIGVLTRDAPALLQATLRPPPQPTPAAVAPKPQLAVATAPQAVDRLRFHESRNRGPAPAALERAQEPPVPQAPAAAADAVAKLPSGPESATVAAGAPAAPTGVAGPVDGALVTDANASGEAVDGLRGYRLALATQARRFKRYPAQAMASGWAGSADVRVEVASDGRPRAAALARSSGYEVLDRAALAMIDAGALRARLPESLRGKAFAVVLPVVFNLDDE